MLTGEQAIARLVDEVLPFWIRHGVDREHGGVMTCLDRDGTVVDTDKGVWQQFRFAWLLARCCRVVEPRAEWLEALDLVLRFGREHAFDADGRMFFHLDREGRPIRKRRYVYSECFASMAFAETAALHGDAVLAAESRRLLRFVRHAMTTPGVIAPKGTGVRPGKPLGHPMISLGVAQVLRDSIGGELPETVAAECVEEIARDFVRSDLEAVLEVVAPDGSVIDHLEGRQLNPGHAIEGAWFVLHEATARRNDGDAASADELVRTGVDMLDWSWRRGWDPEHGGLLSFVDLHGGPTAAYEHDMKFWWPHNEAVLATRHAFAATGDERSRVMAAEVEDWAYRHFDDPDHPEWFGYLRRDGSVSSTLKGNIFKGPFHMPRMLLGIATLEGAIDGPKTAGGLADDDSEDDE